MSFTDSFLDFEAIKNWFDNIPNPDMADGEKIDLGISCLDALVHEPIMEGSDLIVPNVEETECKILESASCSIDEDLGKVSLVSDENGGSVSVDENTTSKTLENESCLIEEDLGKVSLVSGENGNSVSIDENTTMKYEERERKTLENASCLIEEDLGKVSLVSGENGNLVSIDENTTMKYEERESKTLENASCLIEEDSGKVSLVSGENGNSVSSIDENNTTKSEIADVSGEKGETMSVEEESESSESESASSSSSSSSSASSSSDSSSDDESDNDVKEEKKKETKVVKAKTKVNEGGEVEEGEIMDADNDDEDVEPMVGWSDDDELEEGGVIKPIRSKNEVKDLPHVPSVNASLLPHHQMTPVGIVLSILGTQVIVEGIEKHSPLNDGSILWITESRSPLGFVDEIFGPVKNPYYIVRFNSEAEVPAGISTNTLVSFVPEFADHVLNNTDIYKKGYDASGANDEELSDEDEFSDDEKEAEHKRMIKTAKRGTNEQIPRNGKKNNRKNSQNSQPSPSLPARVDHGNFSPSFNVGLPNLPPLAQAACFEASMNGVWPNGVPFQQPPPGFFPNGFPANNMPWLMQNPQQFVYQMPMPNGVPFNPQVNPNQGQPFAGFPYQQGHGGQSSFNPGPFGVNAQGQPFQQQGVNPMGQGFNGPQHGGIPGGNDGNAPQHFTSGPSYSHGGRGSNRRGGGRFGHHGRGRGRN